ncbi:hypothetical protein HMI54_001914 [Coelomomyces lativittatus]|nr:hypothetical protein HMI56_001242 [Coelomomyces lativittatus]KAJ1510010.1 hypothetical protein HMI54_001914 [Coelomomyces lativittatus]KAJ1517545.1 hypothetical protein HMI55_006733 [Coelomomyces lativittatus]
MHKVSYCRHRENLSPSPFLDPFQSSPYFPFYFHIFTKKGSMISNFPITFFCSFDGDHSTLNWDNLTLLRDVALNIEQCAEDIVPGFHEEKGKPMEEKKQEMMVLNEESLWEQPMFTSPSRCYTLPSLGGDSSDYLNEEEESNGSQVPKIKSVKLIDSSMKDSGIELDPTHGCATGLKTPGTSKKRNRNDQAPEALLLESTGTEIKRRKVALRKTESVCDTYLRRQKKEIPVDQQGQLIKLNASETKEKINTNKRQQNEELSSSLSIYKREQSVKQVNEIPALKISHQTFKSTPQKRKQPPPTEESQPEKRVKKSMSKRQLHC